MKKIFTLFILQFFCTLAFSQTNAKYELRRIEQNFDTEKIELQRKYLPNDSSGKPKKLSKSEAAKQEENYTLYYKELKISSDKKKNALDSLIVKLEKENPILGPKSVSEINLPSNITQTMQEAYPQLSKEISSGIDESYFREDGNNKKTLLTFTVDSDGKLKKISGKGNDSEFTRYAVVFLYSLNKRVKPMEENGKYVPQKFSLPIKYVYNY